MVNGALEHLFERPRIRKLFRGWKADPLLAAAFADASLWSKKGGDSTTAAPAGYLAHPSGVTDGMQDWR